MFAKIFSKKRTHYLGKSHTIARLETKQINPSHAMSLWVTPYMKILPLFQWALRTCNVCPWGHMCALCWMYVVYPKALMGWNKFCQSRINKWKLIFPTEWLALNPLFTEILFLSGYFKFDFMWKIFQICNSMCYKGNDRKCKVTRRLWSLSKGIAISISVFGGFS